MVLKKHSVCVVGAGLAGAEAAWQLASRGIDTVLVEMRPDQMTEAHQTGLPAELVCSNSLRSNELANAVGLIKQEMEDLGSLVIRCAKKTRVPAGSALAVDREAFSGCVHQELLGLKNLSRLEGVVTEVIREENEMRVKLGFDDAVDCETVVLASGPLTEKRLAAWLEGVTGQGALYFYDAIAPIVVGSSINMTKAFLGNRWDRGGHNGQGEGQGKKIENGKSKIEVGEGIGEVGMGEISALGDYVNCPMTQEEYHVFLEALRKAEQAAVHEFDTAAFFDGCLPIEEMSRRGDDVLRFGPMKPVGLFNPHEPEKRPYAVVQLRQDNLHATLFNMVGFQTRMRHGEQEKVFRLIPGLEQAEFVRLGSMHRNTYLCSPRVLGAGFELKNFPGIHVAGQMAGCEGYVESASLGLFLGLFLAEKILRNRTLAEPPATTALGALINHVLHADPEGFQPMNVNFGIVAPVESKMRKGEKRQYLVQRAREALGKWKMENGK